MRRTTANRLLSPYDEPICLSGTPCWRLECSAVGIGEGGVVLCGTDDNGAFEMAFHSLECARACGCWPGLQSEKEPGRSRRIQEQLCLTL